MTVEIRHDDVLAGELAWLVLHRVAPDELVIFELTAQEYFADPRAVLHPKRREESVGFGLDLALLTPYVLAVSSSVVVWLGAVVGEVARDESKAVVTAWVRRLFRRNQPPSREPVTPLSIEQARNVRVVAYRQARVLGLADDMAGLIADSVVGAVLVEPGVR